MNKKTNSHPVQSNLSVLIPTLGRDLLKGCLSSIADCYIWPESIILVDQSSSANVAAWSENLKSINMNVIYIASTQKGIAAATNRGIDACTTEFIAITHDDCIVERDWISSMMVSLKSYPNSIITGRVEPGSDGVSVSIKPSLKPKVYTRPLITEDILYPNNMGCSKEIIKTVGQFDESSFLHLAAEDNDWAYRALHKGINIVYSPDVVVKHLDWRDTKQLLATYRAYARSQGGFYGKHLRRGDLFMLLRIFLSLARASRRLIIGIIHRDRDALDRSLSLFTQLFPGILAGLRDTE